ncbi:hypothetical protein [Oscillibacter sp.]|nr:hypothetical protein [Oscillibacter sp.]
MSQWKSPLTGKKGCCVGFGLDAAPTISEAVLSQVQPGEYLMVPIR